MTDTNFYPLAANGADYPRPKVSLLPQPSWAAWFDRSGEVITSAFLNGGASFSLSRYALIEALRRAGVRAGDVVLLPALHCRALVEPVMYLGAIPMFYPVTQDLSPDFDAIRDMLGKDIKASAMVITHYFGFPNALIECESFCQERALVLIEDCAHALYGKAGTRLLGSVGQYAVASLWKFLPVQDGSVLRDNTGVNPQGRGSSRPVLDELKALSKLLIGLTKPWYKNRTDLSLPSVSKLGIEAQRIIARGHQIAPKQGFQELIHEAVQIPALRASRGLSRITSHGRIVQRRRENYQRWLNGVHAVSGVTPLYPVLKENVVPYAFPLLIDSKGVLFHWLKLAGVPMWRWEDMAVTDCAVAQDYRLRLIQLPCHQELRDEELQWMIDVVRSISLEGVA